MHSHVDNRLHCVGVALGLFLIVAFGVACDSEDPSPSCDDIECSENATCEIQNDEPTCVCEAGYTGSDCDRCTGGLEMNEAGLCVEPSNPCDDDPCGDHGSCVESDGEALCICEVGYDGDYCEGCYPGYHDDGSDACVLDETCLSTSCDGHGTCDDSMGTVSCSCDDGYTGDHCESCDEGLHRDDEENCVPDEDCLIDDPCGDHGTCDDSSGLIECSCDEGYAGDFCEGCYPGYHDDGTGACVLDQSCLAGTCSGHGTCDDESGVVTCTCGAGYEGDHCEDCATGYHRDEDELCVADEDCATSDPCGDHGSCVDATGVIECVCDLGFTGDFCEGCYPGYHDDGTGSCVLDESCLAGTCSGYGTCDDASGVVSCTCDTGYDGAFCESCSIGYHRDADESCVADEDCDVSDPCGDHGTCDDSTGEIDCACDLGYTGELCGICYAGYHDDGAGSCVLDEQCRGGTCSGHGSCDDSTGVVTCTCDVGYTVSNCSVCDMGYHRDGEDNCVEDITCAASDPCGDHGTCDDSSGELECVCDLGYDGPFCGVCYSGYHDEGSGTCVLDESCLPSSCSFHGRCDDSTGEVICRCNRGYSGVSCSDCTTDYHRDAEDNCVPDEHCEEGTCGDHGTCDDSSGVIECICDQGYTGDACESCYAGYHDESGTCVLDENCYDTSCSDHGDCDDTGGVVTCDCDDEYTGSNCESCAADHHRDESDNCVEDEDCEDGHLCGEHSTCDDSTGVIECVCDIGYDGETCEDCYPGYQEEYLTGRCELPCPAYQIRCDGVCVVAIQEDRCGDCDIVCPAGYLCRLDGMAECYCPGEMCGDTCVDTSSDEENCGGCGNACVGEECIVGHCMVDDGDCDPTCDDGEELCCGAACMTWEDALTDPTNCGGCDESCTGDDRCAAGNCQEGTCDDTPCGAGELCCGSACVDVASSYDHCGGCDSSCAGAEQCTNGVCLCNYPRSRCDGSCTDRRWDDNNCGECDTVCDTDAGERCVDGVCLTEDDDCDPACELWEFCCSGTCENKYLMIDDENHCGGCDPCRPGELCTNGGCYCWFTVCGDECVNTVEDEDHCGRCDLACEVDEECLSGLCV